MSKINKIMESKARDILLKNDALKIPVDLLAIATNNDIDVYYENLPSGISGAIKYSSDDKRFKILIDASENHVRQRFTLAHELAHFFLEREKLLCNQEIHFDTLYRKGKNPGEEEVEYLAGALLMDKDLVAKLYSINSSIPTLAKVFNVSESAMTVRLIKLGLI